MLSSSSPLKAPVGRLSPPLTLPPPRGRPLRSVTFGRCLFPLCRGSFWPLLTALNVKANAVPYIWQSAVCSDRISSVIHNSSRLDWHVLFDWIWWENLLAILDEFGHWHAAWKFTYQFKFAYLQCILALLTMLTKLFVVLNGHDTFSALMSLLSGTPDTSCFPSSFLQAAAGNAGTTVTEQSDPGMGSWRGMLKRGEEGAAGDRAMPQSPFPSSPQKGHAVNLLDVVRVLNLLYI